MTDPYQFYAPVFPPVEGTYDGYVRVTDVESSPVTALIERYMNRPIETALAAFADGRSLYSHGGTRFNAYVESPWLLTEYGATSASALQSIGFVQGVGEAENECAHGDSVVLFSGGYPSQVREFRNRLIALRSGSAKEAILVSGTITGLYPGVAEEDQTAVSLASSTTDMFIHPEILSGVAAAITEDDVYRRNGKIVESSWNDLHKRFERMDPAHPEHDRFQTFPSTWSDNDLVDRLRKCSAWSPEQYSYLERLALESVLAMMQVADVANALGANFGPNSIS